MGLPDHVIATEHRLRTVERSRAGAVGPLAYLPVRAAAERLGVNPSTVQRRRKREGDARPRRALDEHARAERDAAILECRAGGASIREIAAAVGCSVGTAHRVCKRHARWLARHTPRP